MTEPKIAQTWEDCALHVEAGGVVQYLSSSDGVWRDDDIPAATYRTWAVFGAPSKGLFPPRRLLPIEAPISAGMSPDVPEGCEIVYVPTETIDFMHRSWCGSTDDDSKWRPLDFAIRDAVARRPGEKVHWFEAVGRRDMNGDLITKVTKEDVGRLKAFYYSNNEWHPASDDGLIDVLAPIAPGGVVEG